MTELGRCTKVKGYINIHRKYWRFRTTGMYAPRVFSIPESTVKRAGLNYETVRRNFTCPVYTRTVPTARNLFIINCTSCDPVVSPDTERWSKNKNLDIFYS